MNKDRWLLPEGIEEVLPPRAQQLERLRRNLLDFYRSWGYELVMPPFIEYLESLLVGTGNDLDIQTFKLTDQLNGRLMGVRADMTPQVARIDAHLLKRDTPTRLSYMGTVLHTRPDGFAGSRSPLQLGAELYGHDGWQSDVEIFQLMVETLALCGIDQCYFDLGHVGIFRGLAQQAGLNESQEAELFDALQRKAVAEIKQMLSDWSLKSRDVEMLSALVELNGDNSVLAEASTVLSKADKAVVTALASLQSIATHIQQTLPGISLHYDLAELRGYHYHTGVVFAAYVPGQGQAVAQGGRYDGIGRVFGNARPATGFSTDLKTLLNLGRLPAVEQKGIMAPSDPDADLDALVKKCRAQGEIVIYHLPAQTGGAAAMGCDREIRQVNGQWQVVKLDK